MIFNYAMILTTIPAIILLIIGQRVLSSTAREERRSAWVRIWLVCTVFLTLPFTLTSKDFHTRPTTLVLLLFLPLLEGLLALLILRWREVFAVCKANPRWWAALIVLLALIAASGFGEPSLPLLLAVPALASAGAWRLLGSLRLRGLSAVGCTLLVFLVLDAAGITAPHWVYANDGLRSAYRLISALVAALAPLAAAGLLWRGLESRQGAEAPSQGRLRGRDHIWLASLLMLAVCAVTLRHGLLVHATSRGAEDHAPFGTLAAAVIAGLVLIFALANHEKDFPERKQRWVGIAFTLLLPAGIIAAYSLGWLFNPLAITAARAERLGKAIEQHRQDEYQYPDSLDNLFPFFTGQRWVTGPLTGRGQTWCYDHGKHLNGEEYYRLGYVIFQRYYDWPDGTPFYEPYYEVLVAASEGRLPEGRWSCDEELELMKEHGGL